MSSLIDEPSKKLDYLDINSPETRSFKRATRFRCGRKIICMDQLFGWRGMDTGYYGSSESDDDLLDFTDKANDPNMEDAEKAELEALMKEAMEKLEKEFETQPNFNILKDRAVTPDFSVTYIETSFSESEVTTAEEKTATEDVKTELHTAIGDDKSNGDVDEPMELDSSSYLRQIFDGRAKDNNEFQAVGSENVASDVTYIVENKDNRKSLTATEVGNVNSSGTELQLKLDGTFIIEKIQQAKGDANSVETDGQLEQRNIMVVGSAFSKKPVKLLSSSNSQILSEALNTTIECNLNSDHSKDPSTNSARSIECMTATAFNKQVFECPAPMQTSFDLSNIEKMNATDTRGNDQSVANLPGPQIFHVDLLEQVKETDRSVIVSPPLTSSRTTISFKTPKQRTGTTVEAERMQKTNATPMFKKKLSSPLTARGTSTPVERPNCFCPRYHAHHAAFVNHATQTSSRMPTPVLNHHITSRALTPVRHLNSSVHTPQKSSHGMEIRKPRIPTPTSALKAIANYETPSKSPSTPVKSYSRAIFDEQHGVKSRTPSRIPIPTSAIKAILQYRTPSPKTQRNASSDFESTPVTSKRHSQNLGLNQEHHVCGKENNEVKDCEINLLNPVSQLPLTRFAFEHLKKGGTPRPVSRTRKDLFQTVPVNTTTLPEPRTPVAKADISQMLVDEARKSGPAYRRRLDPAKLTIKQLSFDESIRVTSIKQLSFDESIRRLNLSSDRMNTLIAHAQENSSKSNKENTMNSTQVVVIDSFDDDPDESKLNNVAELTKEVSVTENQNVPSEECFFDTTLDHCRQQQKAPKFDTAKFSGKKRILSVLNDSNVSLNTPGKEEQIKVSNLSTTDDDAVASTYDTSSSPVHITAARSDRKQAAVLRARKIVHGEETWQGLRRSTRNRVAPIRRWLGEKPVYRRDQQGTYELVGVQEAVVSDPLYLKYHTIDMADVIERQKREQKQHARARRLRGYARRDRSGENEFSSK